MKFTKKKKQLVPLHPKKSIKYLFGFNVTRPRFAEIYVFLFFFFFFKLAFVDIFTVNSTLVHYLRTQKLYFLATFLLKMSPTILFTHLKIILLQYFQFQQKFYQM